MSLWAGFTQSCKGQGDRTAVWPVSQTAGTCIPLCLFYITAPYPYFFIISSFIHHLCKCEIYFSEVVIYDLQGKLHQLVWINKKGGKQQMLWNTVFPNWFSVWGFYTGQKYCPHRKIKIESLRVKNPLCVPRKLSSVTASAFVILFGLSGYKIDYS